MRSFTIIRAVQKTWDFLGPGFYPLIRASGRTKNRGAGTKTSAYSPMSVLFKSVPLFVLVAVLLRQI